MPISAATAGRRSAACEQFVVLCRQFNLLTRTIVPIDGSKFKAVNNRDKNFTVAKVDARIEQVKASIGDPAYRGRCVLSGLPEPMLLDAAHIVEDRHESLGQPLVRNSIPLSKIHHAAFDAHLIGIDPDYRLHVSERLLTQRDGPMLEAMKGLNGGLLRLPKRTRDYPDRDRVALRFDRFKAAA